LCNTLTKQCRYVIVNYIERFAAVAHGQERDGVFELAAIRNQSRKPRLHRFGECDERLGGIGLEVEHTRETTEAGQPESKLAMVAEEIAKHPVPLARELLRREEGIQGRDVRGHALLG